MPARNTVNIPAGAKKKAPAKKKAAPKTEKMMVIVINQYTGQAYDQVATAAKAHEEAKGLVQQEIDDGTSAQHLEVYIFPFKGTRFRPKAAGVELIQEK